MLIGGFSFSHFASLMLSWGNTLCNWKKLWAGICIASTTHFAVGDYFGVELR
jgi:hypothetical protein